MSDLSTLPWVLIGWVGAAIAVRYFLTLVLVPSIKLTRRAVRRTYVLAWRRWRYYQTRDTPVAVGQTWIKAGSRYKIDRITDTDRVVIHSGKAQWATGVRRLHLWLER